MNRIRVLIKRSSELPPPSHHLWVQRNVLAVNQEAGGTQPWLVP